MKHRVVVRLFGRVDVSLGESSIVFPSRKATALFAYLCLHRGKQHSRALLADLLWEEADEGSARRNLSTTLWRVRSTFRENDGVRVLAKGDSVALVCDSDVLEVDVETFAHLISEKGTSDEERLSVLKRAEALYKGDFLEGYDSQWCEEARRHYSALYRDVLRSITDLLFERGEYESCAEYLEKLLSSDPLSDDVNAKLMLTYHLIGRRSTALAVYDHFRSLLHTELGLLPAEATTELWNRLRKQADWVAPTPGSAKIPLRSDEQVAEVQLIGREKELGSLVSLLETPGGVTTICVIKGEGGVGKTRLAGALSEEAALRGYEVLQGRCPDLQSPPPYQVFVQALWPRIERYMSSQGPLSGVIERVVAAVSPPAAGRALHEVPEISDSAIVLEVLLRLLTDTLSHRGTLLVLEDLHRMDRASEALLLSLVDRAPKARLVVVVTIREDASAGSPLLDRLSASCSIIDLQPLGRIDTERLASTVLGISSIPRELSDLLWSTACGVPLFSLELLKYLADKGYLIRDSDGIITFDSRILNSERPNFPTRIIEVLRRRIEALEEPVREILSSAAILGAEVGFGELEGILGFPLDQLSEGVERLVACRLLTEGNCTLRFSHDTIRTAVLSSIGKQKLKVLHRRAGELLEHSKRARTEELAWHFGEAGDFQKASRYREISGDTARALHANADALRWYSLALSPLASKSRRDPTLERRKAALLLKRQSVLDLMGDRRGQANDIEKVFKIAARLNDPGLLAQTEYHHSRLLCRENSNQKALGAASRAVQLYQQVRDPQGEANALESMGLAYVNLRDQRGARAAFRRALILFRRARDPAGEARSLVNLGTLLALDGKNADALRHLDQAEHVLRLLDDKRSLAGAVLQKGVLKRCFGHMKASEILLTAGISMMKAVGDRIGEARGLSQLANTHTAMGMVREAMHEARRALKAAVVAGDTRALIVFLNNAAYGPFRCSGDFYRAEHSVGRALKLVAESGRDENLANYYDTMAAVLLDKGEPRQALKWARQSYTYFRAWKGRFRFLGAHIDFRLGMCYLELAQNQKALAFLRKSISAWEREEELGLRIIALSATGRLHAAESRFAQAIAYAREVEGLLRRVDGVDLLQSVHWNQYITFRSAGSDAAARRSLRRAYLCLMQQSQSLKGRFRRRFLYGVKTNREVLSEFERVNGSDLDHSTRRDRSVGVFVHPLAVLGLFDDVVERRRAVLIYLRAGQLTQREIAFRLGVSERTVRSDIASLRRQEREGTGLDGNDAGPGVEIGPQGLGGHVEMK